MAHLDGEGRAPGRGRRRWIGEGLVGRTAEIWVSRYQSRAHRPSPTSHHDGQVLGRGRRAGSRDPLRQVLPAS